MRKKAIFTYSNFQISKDIIDYQKKVIDKFNTFDDVTYEYVFYDAPDGKVFPDMVIDDSLGNLFYRSGYDDVMILDIDCIPLSSNAIEYVFNKTAKGYLVGNIQRANHLNNNKHLYVGAPCCCFSKETFEAMGQPSSFVTQRGDICEEFTYLCEEKKIPIEFFLPSGYEALPHGGKAWPLNDDLPEYGIGSTFVNADKEPMFYHLFESRTNLNIERFVKKCKELLGEV